jgi:hypothetical protein
MPSQYLYSPDQHSTALHDAQSYNDQTVLAIIGANLDNYFGPLDATQRARYFELGQQASSLQATIAKSLSDCMEAFDREGLKKLEDTLRPLAPEIHDPQNWHFHTTIIEVSPRFARALDPHSPRERIQSFTLWEAARLDLSKVYPPSYQNSYLEHSYISRDPLGRREQKTVLSADRFERHAHALDLGSDLQARLDNVMDEGFRKQLTHYHRALYELAGLDALRQQQGHGVDAQAWLMLRPLFNELRPAWTQYQMSFSGNAAPLPFFTHKLPISSTTHAAVSYFPNRAGAALRLHFNEQSAVDDLLDEFKARPKEQWFLEALTQDTQSALQRHVNTPVEDRETLSWIDQQLYDLLGQGTSPFDKIKISVLSSGLTLGDGLLEQHLERLKANLSSAAVTLRDRRWKAFKDYSSIILSETVGLLTIALPGGVLGVNRLMLTATLGSLVYQAINAGIALSQGDRADAVQALADISDLIITGRLQTVGAKLSRRQARQLVHSLSNPTANTRSGQRTLQWHNVDSMRQGLAQQALEVSDLSDAQLLHRLIPGDVPAIEPARAQRLMQLADINRQQLESIWRAEEHAPWQLLHVLQHDFADVAPVIPDNQGTLSKRFPGLSQTACNYLHERHPALRTLAPDAVLSHEQLHSILLVHNEQRVMDATLAFDSGAPTAISKDSEALFCAMLLIQPAWPEKLGIHVYRGSTDFSGYVVPGTEKVASYGLDGADTFISLYRSATRYAGSFYTNDPLQVDAGQIGLSHAVLRTLNDEQRRALGVDVWGGAELASKLGQQALDQRWELAGLLPQTDHYPLGPTRLAPFRQTPALEGIKPGDDGIYALNGKCFIAIGEGIYQVLHDRQASSPAQAVWRIVRPQDPVADAPDNVYVASRPGRSEPVTLVAGSGWQGVMVGGLGGGGRGKGSRLEQLRAKNQKERERAENAKEEGGASTYSSIANEINVLGTKIEAFDRLEPTVIKLSKEPTGRETARKKYMEHYQNLSTYIALVEKNKAELRKTQPTLDFHEYLNPHRVTQIHCLNKAATLIEADLIHQLDVHNLDVNLRPGPEVLSNDSNALSDFRKSQALCLEAFTRRLPITQAHEQTLEKINRSILSDAQQKAIAQQLPASRDLLLDIVSLRSLLLCVSDTTDLQVPFTFNIEPKLLANQFNHAARLFNRLDETPLLNRFALLADIAEQLDRVKSGFELLKADYPALVEPRNEQHLTACIEIVSDCHNLCDEQLKLWLKENQDSPSSSKNLEHIDFDFLPASTLLPSASQPSTHRKKRIIGVKRHGHYRLIQAEQRGDDGNDLIMIGTDETATPRQVSRTAQGAWQVTLLAPQRTLQQLDGAATQKLEGIDQMIQRATSNAQRKDAIAANICEPLHDRADELAALVAQYDKQGIQSPLDQARQDRRQQLVQHVTELRQLAQEITLTIYKNPQKPNADYLTYLIEHQQVQVRKLTTTRLVIGKGKNKNHMDRYVITDLQRNPLWAAHFHYPAADTPREQFAYRSGHLKTLDDESKGVNFQRELEQRGLKVHQILRVEVPTRLAQALFKLADEGQG